MRKLLSSFAAAGALALVAAAATPASALDLDFAGTYSVTSNQGSGLIVDTSPSNGSFNFSLSDSDLSDTLTLFTIYTPEGSVEADDKVAKPITVNFTFTDPTDFGGSVGGSTVGTSSWLLFLNFQNGTVDWTPTVLDFGNGPGKLKISLSDATFNEGLYGLGSKGATIKAKFSIEQMPTGVPEPGTWALMITGFGLAGAALRRQRKLALAA